MIRENLVTLKNYSNRWDFPGGLAVKNLPSNAGDAGSIPGWGTKIPHASGQLSPCTTTTELVCHNQSWHAATPGPTHSGAHTPQLERSPHAATKTWHSQKNKIKYFKKSLCSKQNFWNSSHCQTNKQQNKATLVDDNSI